MTYAISLLIIAVIVSFMGVYFKIIDGFYGLDTILHLYLSCSILLTSIFASGSHYSVIFVILLSALISFFNAYIFQSLRRERLLLLNVLVLLCESVAIFLWSRIMNMPQRIYSMIFGTLYQLNYTKHTASFLSILATILVIAIFYKQLLYFVLSGKFFYGHGYDHYRKTIVYLFLFLVNISLNILIFLSGRVTTLILVILPIYIVYFITKRSLLTIFLIEIIVVMIIIIATLIFAKIAKGIPDVILLSFLCILPFILLKRR
jgi:ABC-type Mn2+/Zn2+ transport system permease subunit